MNPPMTFLKDEQEWPLPAPGKTFLPRAIRDLGRGKFADWNDNNPFAQPTNPLEPYTPIHPHYTNKMAVELLRRHSPELELPQPNTNERGREFVRLTEEQWQIARERRQREIDQIEASKRQYWAVAEYIRQGCACGGIEAWAQQPDGRFEPIPDDLGIRKSTFINSSKGGNFDCRRFEGISPPLQNRPTAGFFWAA